MLERDGEEPHQDRWADTNKETSECPNMRSRRVAKEHNTGPRPGLFSATSPLEGAKLVISEAASSNQKGAVLLVIDVRRAYFYAKARRRVYIELPEGDGGGPGSRQCGLLRKSLYGTRDAAQKLGNASLEASWSGLACAGTSEHVPILRRGAGHQCFGPW